MTEGGPSKATLRTALLAARRARPTAQLAADRAAIAALVAARRRRLGWAISAGYEPLRTEPGSVELLRALAPVRVPILLADRDLSWRVWPSGTDLGAGAIADVDLVVVPALAVDRFGTRLGRGGGSYDRALARVRPGTPVVAVLFDSEFVPDPLPREPWDVPVTAVVTPSGWRSLDAE